MKSTRASLHAMHMVKSLALILLPLICFPVGAVPDYLDYEIEGITPELGSPGKVISLVILDPSPTASGTCIGLISVGNKVIDTSTGIVKISIDVETIDFGVCPTIPRQTAPVVILSQLGIYSIEIYDRSPEFDEERLVETFAVEVAKRTPGFNHESPAEDSIQSGVGVIRGWLCDADRVEVVIDEGERIVASYGTSREDTRESCGDADNGYGLVFNWGLLDEGVHRLQVFLNGGVNPATEVEFEVAGIGEPFANGLSGTYELQGFPAFGESVTVQWSEADQNFIIIDHQLE